MTRRVPCDLFGGAGGDDLAAAISALRPEIDQPVAALDHFEVVFDDHEGVARVGEALEHREQLSDIVEVKSGGRFVEDVERVSGRPASEFAGELDPLRFSAGERRARLTELHVVEADIADAGEHSMNLRMRLEELDRFLDGEVQHVGDVSSAISHFKSLAVVPAALAGLAFHEHVREEVHFDPTHSLALAGFAPSALDVEAESPRLVAADLRFGGHAEELADLVEDSGVGRRIRAGGPADRGLIHVDHAIDPLEAVDPLVRSGDDLRADHRSKGRLEQHFVDQ